MIIFSDIWRNVHEVITTASLMAFINVLMYMVIIGLFAWWIRYYKSYDDIIIESSDVLQLMGTHVRGLQVLKSTIVYGVEVMPCTDTFSHWSLCAHCNNDKKVVLSSSRTNNIHVYTFDDASNPDYKIASRVYAVLSPTTTTLSDVIAYAHHYIRTTTYAYNIFNCQDVVYGVMENYCRSDDIKQYMTVKGATMVKRVMRELQHR